jgi:cytochrome c5
MSRMRGLLATGALLVGVALTGMGGACAVSSGTGGGGPVSPGVAYLTDASVRRAALVRSLVNPANGYSQLRLAHYDTGDAQDWSLLPESNPRVDAIAASELDASAGVAVGGAVSAGAKAIAIDGDALAGDHDALVALGEDAFFRYPVQVSLALETATTSRAAFASYGFWTDAIRGAGGLVRQETPDGGSVLALTCSSCHSASQAGALVIGVGNDTLDIGKLTVDASVNPNSTLAANLLAWGPGRLDVTTNDGTEPVRFGDVRPAQWLTFLQADATVAVHDTLALPIRIETLIITSHGNQDRPPRAITLGLAAYLESLGASLPDTSPTTAAQIRGATLFESSCSSCHVPPALTGPPVPLAAVGTSSRLGLSAVRGTGTYRVPSLHGVSTRGALLHDGSLPSLAALFDPSRLNAGYTGGRLGPGAVAGHVFGLDLDGADRASLVAFLETL